MLNGYKNPLVLEEEFYNKHSKLESRINFWNTFGSNQQTYGDFLKAIVKGSYRSMIDIGCGNAQYSSQWVDFVSEKATFLDISREMLLSADRNLAKYHYSHKQKTEFKQGSLMSATFGYEKFDLVVAMHVLQHIDDISLALEKIKSLVSAKGTVLITTYDNTLDDWLNRTHYDLLKKLKFPKRMLETRTYLSFSGNNAVQKLKNVFPNFLQYVYKNDAHVNEANKVMEYYVSSMMFRMSEGHQSVDINMDQWKELEKQMRLAVEAKIAIEGFVFVKGRVQVFEIKM